MTFSSVEACISSAGPAKTAGQLQVGFAVKDSSLQWTPRASGGDTAHLIALLVALDKDRSIQFSSAEDLTVSVRDHAEIATGQMQTRRNITVNSRTCSVRLVVRDAQGRIGTADITPEQLSSVAGLKTSSHCERK
ncbi:hypothetical protein GP486_008996 [Trichoglossum hirsutum]|uniref:Uncharacterized protein n=1 Tax=Trichoglossum hirsutum TaxID=265104 RepID=A0A9P8HVR3_9PEZI|nr:hypothetical protein GP486_008996 [Trichoglossum hirsutum]